MARSPALWITVLLFLPAAAFAGKPTFQWAAQPQLPTGNGSAYAVAIDADGNSFVTGSFTDTITFSTGTLQATGNTAPNNTDVFVAKYGPDGTVLWARHGGNATLGSQESGYAVAVDNSGSVYVTGEYGGSTPTSFGGTQIAATGGGTFVVKYDAGGTVQWATSVSTFAQGLGIATDGADVVYVMGGGGASFIKRLDASTGNVLDTWDFAYPTDPGMTISVDGSGNVISSGVFFDTVDFDPGPGTSNLVGDSNGDGFIAKHSSTGAFIWALKLASTGLDNVSSHALGPVGDIYFSGSAGADPGIDTVTAVAGEVVGRVNSDGRALWMRNTVSDFFGSPLDLAADVISVDETGSYYISGPGLVGGGTIGTYTIPLTQHFHVVRYAPDGGVDYVKFVTAGSPILPEALSVHSSNYFHVVGWLATTATFDGITLDDVNGSPRSAPFVAQLGIASPVMSSLASVEATPERVRLTWYVTGLDANARVERRRGVEEWIAIGEAARGGPDYLVYEDRDVTPGERLTYRLTWNEGSEAFASEPVQITVPLAITAMALTAAPNPSDRAFDARIEVPAAGEGTLTMHDLQGRLVAERQVRAEGAGRMVVRLGTSELPAGLYWLTLRHGGSVARTRVSIVR